MGDGGFKSNPEPLPLKSGALPRSHIAIIKIRGEPLVGGGGGYVTVFHTPGG